MEIEPEDIYREILANAENLDIPKGSYLMEIDLKSEHIRLNTHFTNNSVSYCLLTAYIDANAFGRVFNNVMDTYDFGDKYNIEMWKTGEPLVRIVNEYSNKVEIYDNNLKHCSPEMVKIFESVMDNYGASYTKKGPVPVIDITKPFVAPDGEKIKHTVNDLIDKVPTMNVSVESLERGKPLRLECGYSPGKEEGSGWAYMNLYIYRTSDEMEIPDDRIPHAVKTLADAGVNFDEEFTFYESIFTPKEKEN